jgi:superfamily II DNA or RNA helicase
MQPIVKKLHTGWQLPDGPRPEWVKMVTAMCNDEHRTELILDKVDICVRNEGRQVLVLSDRVAHCEQMAKQLQEEGLRAAALVGKVSKTKRAELLKKADNRELDVIFATCLADEGLDLPGLDTVFLTVPTKAMGRIQQRIGRIMRIREGKQTPIVYDVIDNEPFFVAMSRKRTRLYNSLGCQLGE